MAALKLIQESANSYIFLDNASNGSPQTIIKVPKPNEEGVQQAAYLKHEYELTRQLDLHGVRKAISETDYDGSYAIRLDYIDGMSLREFLDQHPYDFEIRLKIAIQATQILGELHHHGIIHNDINSHNILLETQTNRVHLIDFGLARRLGQEEPQLSPQEDQISWNYGEGTLAYLSPEQSGRVSHKPDSRSDLYSWGITMYEMFVGELPFKAKDPASLVHAHLAEPPPSPSKRNPKIPTVVSQIILKLLAKNPEHRYQSAAGLEADLVQCWEQQVLKGEIHSFKLSQFDEKPLLHIPEQMYGRDDEIASLQQIFKACLDGKAQWVSITGPVGVGKSKLGRQLREEVIKAGGYFLEGKFDHQYQHTPYYAWLEAFEIFLDDILTEQSSRLEHWKDILTKALGQNGKLLTDVLPKLELIIGKQAEVPYVGAQEAVHRFNNVLSEFIDAISEADFPLVIQLDDWHYADMASVELLQIMLSKADCDYFVLLTTYREEALPDYAKESFEYLRSRQLETANLVLNNYKLSQLASLVEDTLDCEVGGCQELVISIYEKTGGNPLFAIQMLKSLFEDGLLTYSTDTHDWSWDIDRIQQLNISDNVADLMAARFRKFPPNEQHLLQLAASIGDDFVLEDLASLEEKPIADILHNLTKAINEGILIPFNKESHYRFAHSRIRKTIYRLHPEDKRANIHARIAAIKLRDLPDPLMLLSSEDLFELMHHFKHGRPHLQADEKILAELYLIAAQRAVKTAAYPEAQVYIDEADQLLPENHWESDLELSLSIYRCSAQLAYLQGNTESAERCLQKALKHCVNFRESIELLDQLIIIQTAHGQYTRAFHTGIKALTLLGFSFRYEQAKNLIIYKSQEIEAFHSDLSIESLAKLPSLAHENIASAIKILTHMEPAAHLGFSREVWALVVLKATQLTLKNGLTTASSYAYIGYAQIIAHLRNKLKLGYQLGVMALRLSQQQGDQMLICRVSAQFGGRIHHWRRHLRHAQAIFDNGFQAGLASGEMAFASYILMYKLSSAFAQGIALSELERRAKEYQSFSQLHDTPAVSDTMQACLHIIQNLQGNDDLSEVIDANWLEKCHDRSSMTSLGIYLCYHAMESYLLGKKDKCRQALAAAEALHPYMLGMIQLAEWYVIKALSRLGDYETLSRLEQAACIKEIKSYLDLLKNWAQNCPENFLHKFFLIEAEYARVEGRYWDAARRYDAAIEEARNAEFVQYEALANELAGRFWQLQRKHVFARTYIRQAHTNYLQWGALRKADNVSKRYALYFRTKSQSGSSSGSVNLDTQAILKASQAFSGEIVLSNLLEKMMRIVLENAGAAYGVFIQASAEGLRIQAKGSISKGIDVLQGNKLEDEPDISQAIVNYVARTQEALVLDDASKQARFELDTYIQNRQVKSVLCTPIIHKSNLQAILYLENNLVTGAFTEDRLDLLKALSAQIAISFENALLYEQLDAKVKARTKDLDKKNAELSEALDQLSTTQVQLIDSAKMASLGQLTAGIAHEINNPINFVTANVQPLQRDFADLKDIFVKLLALKDANNAKLAIDNLLAYAKDLDIEFLFEEIDMLMKGIDEGAKRTHEIVMGLKNFSRLEEDSFKLADIHEGIEATLMLLANKTKESIKVSRDYGELPQIDCLPGKLNQVFMNILSNAIDALQGVGKSDLKAAQTKPIVGDHVHIKTWQTDDHVFILIKDNGIGMSREIQENIFDPFFTTKEVGTGTGLGLSITKGIIDRHNGSIKVNSAPLEGCEFEISLPIKQAET